MAKSTKNKKSQSRKSGSRSRSKRQTSAGAKATMVFSRGNYLLLILGVALVIFGYTIMRMENEVDGFISLYVAPLIILGGYLEIIYAILWRPKSDKPADTNTDPAVSTTESAA